MPFRVPKARCTRETRDAINVTADALGPLPCWIPKSVIDDDSEVYKAGTEGVLIVADWFAEQRGWD